MNKNLRYSNSELIKGSEFYLDRIIKEIDSAEDQIVMNVYHFENDSSGEKVVKALLQSAKKGVKLYISIDSVGSMTFPKKFFRELSDLGANFTYYNPLLSINIPRLRRRLHQKVMVFDAKRAFIGGINIADEYLIHDEDSRWLDYVLYLEGNAVSELLEIVSYYHKCKIPLGRLEEDQKSEKGNVQFLLQDFWRGKRELSNIYKEKIKGAEKSILIMNAYFFPGKSFIRNLKKAVNRGVDVTLILGRKSDIPAIQWLTNCLYDDLLKAGIKIYEWEKSMLHAKVAVIDSKWCTIGSFNLDFVSKFSNIEINVSTDSPEIINHVHTEIEKVLSTSTKKVSLKKWKKRYYLFYRLRDLIALGIFKLLSVLFPPFKAKK